MRKAIDQQLDTRLNAYAATVRNLKRGAERWPVYAAVTGAAIAMASNASASVIYSGVIDTTAVLATGHHSNSSLGPNSIVNAKTINLGNATGDHFGIFIGSARTANSVRRVGFSEGPGLKIFMSHFDVQRLSSGAKISGGGRNFGTSNGLSSNGGQAIAGSSKGHRLYGWSRTEGFVGFEFSTINKNQTDFGWAQLQFTPGDEVTVVDWAYDNSGAAILAGQEVTLPEPSSMALMLLAAGAAGVEALRRRRAKELSAIGSQPSANTQ